MKTERAALECSLFQISGCVARVIAGAAVVFTLHILLIFSCCFNSVGLPNTKTPTESQKKKKKKNSKQDNISWSKLFVYSVGILVFFQNSRVLSSLILLLRSGSTSNSPVIVTVVLSLFNGAGTWRSTCFADIAWIKIRLLLAVKWISIASGTHQSYSRLAKSIQLEWGFVLSASLCGDVLSILITASLPNGSKKMIIAVFWRSSMTEKKTIVLVLSLEPFHVRFMPWICFVWGLCPGAVSCEVYAVRSTCGLTHAWSFPVCVRLHLPVCLVSVDSRAGGRMLCSIDARNDGHFLGNQKNTRISWRTEHPINASSAGFRRGDPTTSFNNQLSCIDRCLQFISILPVFPTRAL